MEYKNQKKYSFLSKVLILFAVDILLLMLLASILGDEARKISPVYQLGSKGLAISTMLQFLLSAFLIVLFQQFYFSERIFKSMMTLWRTILLFFSVLAASVVLILVFDWFPLNDFLAWATFLILFGGGFVIGTASMIIKTRLDNKKYNELLHIYKEEHREENENE